jgi:hypothetical protein
MTKCSFKMKNKKYDMHGPNRSDMPLINRRLNIFVLVWYVLFLFTYLGVSLLPHSTIYQWDIGPIRTVHVVFFVFHFKWTFSHWQFIVLLFNHYHLMCCITQDKWSLFCQICCYDMIFRHVCPDIDYLCRTL